MRVYKLRTAAFTYLDGTIRLTGEVESSLTDRWAVGNIVRTSALKSIDFERKFAVTQNSVYHFETFIH